MVSEDGVAAREAGNKYVSILIILEVVSEGIRQLLLFKEALSFNPYYSGSGI